MQFPDRNLQDKLKQLYIISICIVITSDFQHSVHIPKCNASTKHCQHCIRHDLYSSNFHTGPLPIGFLPL